MPNPLRLSGRAISVTARTLYLNQVEYMIEIVTQAVPLDKIGPDRVHDATMNLTITTTNRDIVDALYAGFANECPIEVTIKDPHHG